MYLADNNDRLVPGEHDAAIIEYFDACPGGENPDYTAGGAVCAAWANPYLRPPVVLDEYIKNRDVWRCPSARLSGGATFILPYPDWFSYIKGMAGAYGVNSGYEWMICNECWPSGWGGDVTDTLAQERLAVPSPGESGPTTNKAFVQSIATPEQKDLKLVSVQDPVSYIICADGGAQTKALTVGTTAYPEVCALQCSTRGATWGCFHDWDACTWAVDCGLYNHAPNDGSFLENPDLRKPFARHLGGVNCGFLDGHASWINSDLLVRKHADGDVQGLLDWGPTSACVDWDGMTFFEKYPGAPLLW